MIIPDGIYRKIPLSEIDAQWERRKRRTYDDIEKLANNILQWGLINPITCFSADGKAPFVLLAGGRRLKACEWARIPTIDAHVYERTLSSLEMKAIELYENSMRNDLPFSDAVKFTQEFDDTLRAIHGSAIPGKKNSEGHSLQKTAEMLNKSIAAVSSDKKLAEAMLRFPELQLEKEKNKAAALNRVRRFENIVRSQALAAPLYEEESYILGDFFLNELEPGGFQFIEIDPPYAIDLVEVKRGHSDRIRESYAELISTDYPEFIKNLAIEIFRLSAENAWVICWCGPQWFSLICNTFNVAGFDMNHLPAVWKKGSTLGQCNSPGTSLASSVEYFLYGRKGSPELRKRARSNIFDFPPLPPSEKIHDTQKPQNLMDEILETFCWDGYNILVPFAGSGVTLSCAKRRGHRAIGFDLSVEFRNAYLASLLGENGK